MKHLRYLMSSFSRRHVLVGLGGLATVFIIVQLLYPAGKLLPFASIDTHAVGGWDKTDAIWELDRKVNSRAIPVYLNDEADPYTTLKPKDIGLSISNQARVSSAEYAWYMRLVPTSLLWFGLLQSEEAPKYEHNEAVVDSYIKEELGDCDLDPKNASVEFKDGNLQLIKAESGGTCDKEKAKAAIGNLKPSLEKPGKLKFEVEISKPKVKDDAAKQLIERLQAESKGGVELTVNAKAETIPQKTVLSWLDFAVKKDKLEFSINEEKSDKYFSANVTEKVSKPAGTTRISTRDFTVLSRVNGPTGRTLAAETTRASIVDVLSGEKDSAQAVVTSVAPKVVYQRSYTKTSVGITALLAHYAKDHAGTFGVSFQELGGAGRSAQFDSSRVFTTASTYKLFVAYGTLKKVEAGKWKWSDVNIANGRNLSTCFDDMIVKSDNPCAEALLKKYGYSALTRDIAKLGLGQSGWKSTLPQTTAYDMAVFLRKLQTNQLPLKASSRDQLLAAMKRTIHRQGIPAGASGQVADKVGFLNGLLHDASIVYSPKGAYVLVILTDGSTWGNIAELTRKIESLR